jgi:sugar (pentulose or hexulose) kinase
MKPDLIVGIDQSTTATKAIAFNARGHIVAEGRATVPLSNPKMGWFEQEVSDWTGSVATALKQLTRKISKDRIAAVSISNQRESFAQFDSKGKALRPGTLWLDERAHVEVKEIAAEVGLAKLHELSGIPNDITPCRTRCRWLSKHEPKVWNRTAKTAEVHGVITHFLTGEWKTSLSSASPMGLLDAKHYDWSDILLKAARLTRAQLFLPVKAWVLSHMRPQNLPVSKQVQKLSQVEATDNAPGRVPILFSRVVLISISAQRRFRAAMAKAMLSIHRFAVCRP